MSSKNVVDLRKAAAQKAAREEVVERRSALGRPPQEPHAPLARRSATLRARRRKWRAIIALIVLVVIAAGAYGVSWLSYLPKYSVDQVTVVGTQEIPQKLLYDYVETQLYKGAHPFISPNNVLLFNAGALERDIAGFFPRIASAKVARASMLATAVTVTVTERQPYALWCTDDTQTDCYYMDQGGFIFAQAPSQNVLPTISASSTDSTPPAGGSPQAAATSTSPNASSPGATMYVFEGAIATSTSPIGQTFVGAHFPGILALLQSLSQSGFTPLGATIENDTDFSVPLSQGYYLKASFGEDSQQLVQNLQLVLSSDALQGDVSQLEYVDLRFGDRVYYKLNGQAETQTPQ